MDFWKVGMFVTVRMRTKTLNWLPHILSNPLHLPPLLLSDMILIPKS